MANQKNTSNSTIEKYKAPDSLGVVFCFLMDFGTLEMLMDFPAIQKDFLKNCYNKILSSQIQFLDVLDNEKNSSPMLDVSGRILNYIYNGAKNGDEYCLSLIKYLYKTYHKKEYNQLKKFRKITEKDVFSLVESEDGDPVLYTMARILEMSHFLDIEIDSTCSSIYSRFDAFYKFYLERLDKDMEQEDPLSLRDANIESSIQITKWILSLNETELNNFEQSINDTWTVVEKALNKFNFPSNFLQPVNTNNVTQNCIIIHSILKKINPDKDITLDEVSRHVPLLRLIEFITKYWREFQKELYTFFGGKAKYEVREVPNFETKQPENKTPEKVSKFIAPAKIEEVSHEKYLDEIASLRAKLQEKEMEVTSLKELYRDAKVSQQTSQQNYESLQKEYENQRKELIALRDFAYRSSKEFEDLPQLTIAEMQKAIETKEIIIIGGHVNWINKLQKTFPNWEIIPANASRTIDTNILTGKERVYFFTDYIDHTTYGKYVAICREKQIPFGYLHGVNIETMTQQIYEDMCEK